MYVFSQLSILILWIFMWIGSWDIIADFFRDLKDGTYRRWPIHIGRILVAIIAVILTSDRIVHTILLIAYH